MKTILSLFLIIFLALPSLSETLNGGVTYDVDSARNEAFENLDYSFSPDLISKNLLDTDSLANQSALLTGNTSFKDRILCKFSTGIYGVRYNDDPYRAYYYTKDGRLDYVDKKSRLEYPHKVSTYNLKGELISTALYISKQEQYIFDLNKSLTTHWVGDKGYDKNGVQKWSRVYTQ